MTRFQILGHYRFGIDNGRDKVIFDWSETGPFPEKHDTLIIEGLEFKVLTARATPKSKERFQLTCEVERTEEPAE